MWGDSILLSKLQYKIHAHWYGTLYFQVLSANSFIIVFDSGDARDKALSVPFFWLGKNLIFVETWKPFFAPSGVGSKKVPSWFKLPLLPSEFVESDILTKIGDSFGKFLLSHSVFEDGLFMVKIYVLLSGNVSPPKTCNIRSSFGIWHQNLIRDSMEFGHSSVIMDSPLFFHIKMIKFGSKVIDSSIDKNVEMFA